MKNICKIKNALPRNFCQLFDWPFGFMLSSSSSSSSSPTFLALVEDDDVADMCRVNGGEIFTAFIHKYT